MSVTAGSILSCTNTDCPCRLELQVPCPHGDAYTCACGHPLVPVADDGDDRPVPTPGA